jgi:hypothetical protein
MSDLTLTPQEHQMILDRREQKAREDRGVLGTTPQVDEARADLLRQLDELNNRNLGGSHGPLPAHLDAETVALIMRVQATGIGMKSMPYGDANPIHIPSRVAYESSAPSAAILSRSPAASNSRCRADRRRQCSLTTSQSHRASRTALLGR